MECGLRRLHIALAMLLACLLWSQGAHADAPAYGFVGKDEWLFYRVELSDAADQPAIDQTIDLISRFNKVLSQNGITMAFVMVPLKMRIYAEHLPDDVKMTPFMADNYDRMAQALRSGNVNVIDLNTPFLHSSKRDTDLPFYFRLDTHWSPSGSMFAAETIRAGIDADPVLKKVLDTVPIQKFSLSYDKGGKKIESQSRDLINLLPPSSHTFGPELKLHYNVSKSIWGSLFGDESSPAITLLGSSYSKPWGRMPDALRYTLQRGILALSFEAIEGSWVGMESFLSDDSFQTKRPTLLIWEMPERDMRMPPDYPYRETRYHRVNTEWLLRASAWVQRDCAPSQVAAKINSSDSEAKPANNVALGSTSDKDFIELSFDTPLGNMDYLMASIATNGSKNLAFEASGEGEEPLLLNEPVPGDGAEHLLKIPLMSHKKGYTKLRIYPGKSSAFTFKGLRICSQPVDLLK